MRDVRLPAAVGDEAFEVGGDENARFRLRGFRFGGRFSRAVAIPVRFSGRGPAGIPAGPGAGRSVRFVWIVFDSQRREVAPGCERPDVNDSVLVTGRYVAQ